MSTQIPLTSTTSEQDVSGSELLVNIYPRTSVGSKYGFNLVHSPGLAFFCELPTLPILALHQTKDRAFAVTSSRFYEIFSNGGFKELGAVDFDGRISIADNGHQIVAVNGSNGYYYDIDNDSVHELESYDFFPSTVTYQDGYFIFNRKNTNQFFISDLLSANINPINFASAEGQPDNIVSIISDHREVFIFGVLTTEVWFNSGNSDFPLERNQGAFIEKGCAAQHSVAKQNNTVYFIGSDLMVYRMSGYNPVRISTNAVEKTLAGNDISDAFAYTYQEDGQLFYMLTIPSIKLTWCYDISTGSWHIRDSYNFKRHISNNAIFYDSKTLVGDFQSGIIYEMTRKYLKDNEDPIIREFTLPTVNYGRDFITIDSLEFDMDTGIGLDYGYGIDPEMRVYFSKDDGNVYSENYKQVKLGRQGIYLQRAKSNRFGAARQFTFKIEISDPVPINIGGAWVEIR